MNKVTVNTLRDLKKSGEKITCLTAYDASFAALIDEAKVETILVGDSLGMVIQGHDSTLPVTMDDILYHTKAVTRVTKHALVIADMPFMSYATPELALINAGRLVKEAGAHMVKLEGGENQIKTVTALTNQNIAVCAHLGLQPQSINKLGAYRVQGRDELSAQEIMEDALALEQAGANLLVLECVPAALAKAISEKLTIPTIGIGAGVDSDGQVLVMYDLIGISFGKIPKFAKNFLNDADSILQSFKDYVKAVKNQSFPEDSHTFF